MADRDAPLGAYFGDEFVEGEHGGSQVTVQRGQASCGLEPSAPSRDRFSWGYDGGGPLSLAAAILRDYLGFHAPETMISSFRDEVVANLPRPRFELSLKTVADWEAAYRARDDFREEAERTVLGLLIAGQTPEIEISEEHFRTPRSHTLFGYLQKLMAAGERRDLDRVRAAAGEGLIDDVTSNDVWMLHDTAAEGPGINFWASRLVR